MPSVMIARACRRHKESAAPSCKLPPDQRRRRSFHSGLQGNDFVIAGYISATARNSSPLACFLTIYGDYKK